MNRNNVRLTLSLSEDQIVIDKKRCATTGSKQTAIVKIMVSQRYGCLRAFGAVPWNKKSKN